jgi:hypothetical protein
MDFPLTCSALLLLGVLEESWRKGIRALLDRKFIPPHFDYRCPASINRGLVARRGAA